MFEDIMLKMDRLENESLPQVKLGKNEVISYVHFIFNHKSIKYIVYKNMEKVKSLIFQILYL